jgi:dissimilatory sulfite reductase (desulfoviridin) alpha/beta subunit
MVQYIKYKTTQIGDKIIDRDLHWEEIYNYQTLHVTIVDSIMKEEDAQRMGKTVDRVGKKNHFASRCRTGYKQDDQQNKRGMISRGNRRNVRTRGSQEPV